MNNLIIKCPKFTVWMADLGGGMINIQLIEKPYNTAAQ